MAEWNVVFLSSASSNDVKWLDVCYPTVSVKACFVLSVCRFRLFVRLDRSCYLDIS